ncbi:BRO-N domain-containing protein [Salinicola avicenniae]|uniref:BRO-N domain-containing protein n=1 Tax=Salinicola avicenniae TaxID=2916836 RepID=UPI002072A6E4|nr:MULTISPECIES: BRO family protein [unclassified Salinicola]
MTQLIPFEFDAATVRVIQGDDGEALFVGHDIATALGYAKPENAIARHCRRQTTTPKQGGGYHTVIRESDVYRLIVRSKLPSAERFEAWVFEEVLPAIRKHGRYEAPAVPVRQDKTTDIARASAIASALDGAARAFGFDDNMRLLSVNQAVQKRTGVDLLAELGATHLLSPINERYMTVTELGTPCGMSGRAVNLLLRDLGYQWQDKDGRGKTIWRLTDAGRAAGGRMLDTGKKHGDGTPVQQLKWPESVAEVLREEAA